MFLPLYRIGHGTHVAGIIGADMDDSPFKLHGVAFDAELYAYRVSACAGGMDDDVIVAALLRAEKDGCDVMNLSLGGPSGWIAGSSSSIVVSRLAKRGKVLTISAGNEGKYGAWYGSGPASGEGAIAVGSIESPVIPLQTVTVGGDVDHDPIMYYDLFPLTNNTKPIAVYAITEEMGYGCKPLPKDTPNLENYVVLVKLVGRCKRPKQMKNIMAKGAKLALVWNKPVFNNLDDDGVDIPVSLIQEKDGEFLEKQLLANKKITLTFPEDPVLAHYDTADGNLMDNFSTYGPTYDFRFKPSVSAHGGSILSTIPRSQGSYGFKSGTSMSAPYVAGCAALILQARGRSADVARQVRDLLETTSVPVLSNHSKNALLQTVTIAGAGMVDAYAAAHSETLLWPGELLLNDTKHFNGTQEFTVKNAGKENKKYSIDHYPAGTAITIKPGTTQVAPGPVPLSHSYASVELGATSFSLKPNEEKTITVKFTPPQGLDPKTLPVYSGFIQVAAEGEGEAGRLHVSYMGVAGSLYDQPVIEVTDRWHSTFTVPSIGKIDYEEETSKVQTKEQTYKFKGDEEYPKLYYRFSFGTPRYVIDLVSASLDLEKLPDPVPIFGNLENDTYVNLDYDTEDLSDAFWEVPLNNNATFSNGTFVPSGSYKILMRALRVTGDPENPDDYDKWLSPPITLEFTSDDKRLAAVSGNSTQDEEHGDHEADPDENGGQGADSEEHGGKGADSEEHEGQEADKDEQHEALIAEKPIYQRGWFIAVVIAAALLVIAGIAAGVIHHKRKRRSTIASEAAFVPAIGAYKPLVDETKEVGSYSATAYHARPAHEEGRYS
ncbi:hypothetical protein V5O48_014617 [Marasmius crinis-equi]|uniref:Uncharacterized protein n=1 Tax=Marasmius crinis-equi TaxID=585013 RepID=A0ABR3EWS4_9AGAR